MAGLKDTFSKGITTINVKTSTMLEQNKINTYIANLETEIVNLKNKAGHELYDSWKAGNASISTVENLFRAVDEKLAEIERQKQKAEELMREEQQILGMNAQNNASQQAPAFCGNCGAPCIPGSRFCTKCGAPLQ